VVVRETVPNVAEIVDEPAETAVARPEALIVARVGAEEAHVTWLVMSSEVESE
jgi:hypothetical protein